MPNVLEVQIVGDVSGLEKSLKKAGILQFDYTKEIEKTSAELKDNINVTNGYKKAIEDLNNEYKKGSISSKEYQKQLSNLKRDEKESAVVTTNLRKELANLKREQKDLGGTTGVLSKRTADGSNALTQFSRIAQDAPFGIQGIGNNITATVEAFGHLQKSSGSTGAALKAVAGSILGSGGILLAVSLVTTGLTYMAQNGITVGDVFDKLTGTFDENAKALSEINKEAAKTAGEEIANIKAYVSVAQDRDLSDEKRLLAVKQLQSEYPAYFGNLSTETILNGDLAGTIEEVSKALRDRARATAIAGKLGENAAKRLELEEKREKAIQKIREAQAKSEKDGSVFAAGNRFNLKAAVDDYKNITSEIRELDIQSKKLENTQAKSTKDSIDLLEQQTEAEKILADAKAKAEADAKAKKESEELAKKIKAPIIERGEDTLKAQDLVDVSSIAVVTGELDEFGNKIKGIAEISVPAIELKPVVTSEFIASLERANETAKIVSGAIGSSISELANQMQSSLQTGNAVLDAFVGSLIGSLAQIAQAQLTSLITEKFINTAKIQTNQAVSTANAVTAATSTAAAAGPAAAVLLPGLVGGAIALMTSTFAGIQALAFAHGGVVPGGSYTGDKIPAMLNSGEAVLNNQQQANVLMSIANGNSNSLQSNRVIDNFEITSVLRGADILLSVERQKRKR